MRSTPFDEPRAPRREADVVRRLLGCCYCRRRRWTIITITNIAFVGGIVVVSEQSSDYVRRQHRGEVFVVRDDALQQGEPNSQQGGRRVVLRASLWRDAFSRTSRYQRMKKLN